MADHPVALGRRPSAAWRVIASSPSHLFSLRARAAVGGIYMDLGSMIRDSDFIFVQQDMNDSTSLVLNGMPK
jgi:hypothetical protein